MTQREDSQRLDQLAQIELTRWHWWGLSSRDDTGCQWGLSTRDDTVGAMCCCNDSQPIPTWQQPQRHALSTWAAIGCAFGHPDNPPTCQAKTGGRGKKWRGISPPKKPQTGRVACTRIAAASLLTRIACRSDAARAPVCNSISTWVLHICCRNDSEFWSEYQ